MAKRPAKSEAAKLAEARKKKRASLYKKQAGAYKGIASTTGNSAKAPPMSKRKYNTNINIRPKPLPKNLVKPLPETKLSLKGVSLRKFLKETTPDVSSVYHEIAFKGVKQTKTDAGFPAVQASARHKDPWRPNAVPRYHKCTIMGMLPNKPISKQDKVMCSCDCEDWMYRWEYAAAIHGATRIVYGNGQPARLTNPKNTLGLCKHLYALGRKIQESGK